MHTVNPRINIVQEGLLNDSTRCNHRAEGAETVGKTSRVERYKSGLGTLKKTACTI